MSPDADYLRLRGFSNSDPDALQKAMQIALDAMEPLAYGDARSELTEREQQVLTQGGLSIEARPGEDPLTTTTAKYAAIIARSLSTADAGKRLKRGSGRIRQMIIDRSLLSILVDNTRYIPEFQFLPAGALVPNLSRVNRALRPTLHPVEIYNWLHLPNQDLFVHDDIDQTLSPLQWLAAGHDAGRVVSLAEQL